MNVGWRTPWFSSIQGKKNTTKRNIWMKISTNQNTEMGESFRDQRSSPQDELANEGQTGQNGFLSQCWLPHAGTTTASHTRQFSSRMLEHLRPAGISGHWGPVATSKELKATQQKHFPMSHMPKMLFCSFHTCVTSFEGFSIHSLPVFGCRSQTTDLPRILRLPNLTANKIPKNGELNTPQKPWSNLRIQLETMTETDEG